MKEWRSGLFPDRETVRQIRGDLRSRTGLKYAFHPMFGWRPYPGQKCPTIEINGNSLRSKEISSFKDHDSVGLFIGGSFAWGYGVSSNEFTPAYLLEKMIYDRHRKRIGFINLADQMYSSVEQLKTFVFSIDELKPAFVICVSGHSDINVGYEGKYKRQDMDVRVAEFYEWGRRTKLYRKDSFLQRLITILKRGHWKKRQFPREYYSFGDPSPDEIPTKLYAHKIEVMSAVCQARGIKLIDILQPSLYLKKHRVGYERTCFESEDPRKVGFFVKQYAKLREAFWNNPELREEYGDIFFDSNSFIENRDEELFFDNVHFTDKQYVFWTENVLNHLETISFFDL